MAEHPNIIIIDNTIRMHGAVNGHETFYHQAGYYLKSLANEETVANLPPDYFSTITIYRGKEVIPVKDLADYKEKVDRLSKDLSISFTDQVPHWKQIVENIEDDQTNVYILTSRVERDVAEWFYIHPINVVIIDFSKGEPEDPKDDVNQTPAEDVARLIQLQKIGYKNTVIDFGEVCIGDSILQCTAKDEAPPIFIHSIHLYGTAVISKVDGFPIAATGKFTPTQEEMCYLAEQFERDKSRKAHLPKDSISANYINNVDSFNTLFHLIDTMTVEANETIIFFGKARCRDTGEYVPALLKSSSTFVPVEEVPPEEPKPEENEEKKDAAEKPEEKEEDEVKETIPILDDSMTTGNFDGSDVDSLEHITLISLEEGEKTNDEDEKMSVDGWEDYPEGIKKGPNYFEIQLLDMTWREFKAYAKVNELILSDEDLHLLDRMYPPPVPEIVEPSLYDSEAISFIFHRMLRALRKLPERTAIYEKETAVLSRLISMSQSRAIGCMFARIIRRESEAMPYTQQHIANETGTHFVSLAVKHR